MHRGDPRLGPSLSRFGYSLDTLRYVKFTWIGLDLKSSLTRCDKLSAVKDVQELFSSAYNR